MLECCVFHIDAVLQDLEAKTWMEMSHASRHPPFWKEAEMQWTRDQLVLVQEPDSHLCCSNSKLKHCNTRTIQNPARHLETQKETAKETCPLWFLQKRNAGRYLHHREHDRCCRCCSRSEAHVIRVGLKDPGRGPGVEPFSSGATRYSKNLKLKTENQYKPIGGACANATGRYN